MPIIIIHLVLGAGKIKQILGPDWLPEQKRRRKKKFSWPYNKCLVKMAGH